MQEQEQEQGERDAAAKLDAEFAKRLPWVREVAAKGLDFGMQSDGKFVLPLKDPVSKAKETVDRLSFRPCTGADLRWFGDANQTADLGRLLALAGRLTGEVDVVLDRLSARDAHRVCEVAAAFFFGSTELLGGGS